MNLKTEHEFFSQVDALTKDSVKSPERLAKLGDLKAKWRAAKNNPEALSVLADELDAIAVEVKAERPKPDAAAAKPPAKPTLPTYHGRDVLSSRPPHAGDPGFDATKDQTVVKFADGTEATALRSDVIPAKP